MGLRRHALETENLMQLSVEMSLCVHHQRLHGLFQLFISYCIKVEEKDTPCQIRSSAQLWHIPRAQKLPRELLFGIRAITARSARQRISEYSDDFDSDKIVSLGEFSDTSTDESLVRKKMNDFHISDDEEKNSPRLSFLKTKKVNKEISKDDVDSVILDSEVTSPDAHEHMTGNSFPKSQNDDQEVGREIISMKPTPRVLPFKRSTSSGENSNSLDADGHSKPLPRPRSMLKKNSHTEDEVRSGVDKEYSTSEDSALTPSLPRQNGRVAN